MKQLLWLLSVGAMVSPVNGDSTSKHQLDPRGTDSEAKCVRADSEAQVCPCILSALSGTPRGPRADIPSDEQRPDVLMAETGLVPSEQSVASQDLFPSDLVEQDLQQAIRALLSLCSL